MLEFNPRNRKVEYLATSGTDLVRRVRVSCVPVGSKTEVSVAYVVTSMSPAGASASGRRQAKGALTSAMPAVGVFR
jgi:hypothetical protein